MVSVEPSDDVVALVGDLAAASSRPTLTTEQVKRAVRMHPRPDLDGVTVTDDTWVPTWNTDAAVADLWGLKAGMVAGDFSFGADGARFDKGEVMAHCLEMQAKYAAKGAGSVGTYGGDLGDYPGDIGRLIVNG